MSNLYKIKNSPNDYNNIIIYGGLEVTGGTSASTIFASSLTITGDTVLGSFSASSISSNTITYREQEIDDRFVNVTGDTINGSLTINGDLTVTGDTVASNLSASSISALTLVLSSATDNQVLYRNSSGQIVGNTKLTFDGAEFRVGGALYAGSWYTILSAYTNDTITLNPGNTSGISMYSPNFIQAGGGTYYLTTHSTNGVSSQYSWNVGSNGFKNYYAGSLVSNAFEIFHTGGQNKFAVNTTATTATVTVKGAGKSGLTTTFSLLNNDNTPVFTILDNGYTSLQGLTAASISSNTITYREQELDDRFVNVTGDTINGSLTINGDLIITGTTNITIISASSVNLSSITNSDDIYVITPSGNTLFLDSVVWRDEFPSSPWVPAAGAAAPDLNNYTIGGVGTRKYGFDGGTTEERLSSTFEIPHDYAYGYPIEAHVHWRPSTTTTGTTVWWFDWSYDAVNVAPSGQTSLSAQYTITANSQYYHFITTFGFLPTGITYTIGAIINFNIRRTPAFSSDTYTGDAILEQVALHVPIDTLGSRQIYVK